jgi:DNA-binding CsgD family transcriptional regulator
MQQVRKIRYGAADGNADPASPVTGLHVVETRLLLSARPPPLTRRERQCLGWCAEGKSYWETAVILGIAERTVSFHMEAVRGKLEAASNAHAVARAMAAGLLRSSTPPVHAFREALR